MNDIGGSLVNFWNEITGGASLAHIVFNLAQASLFLIVLIFIGRLIKRGLTKLIARTSRNASFAALLGNLAYSAILVLAVLVALTVLTGTQVSNLFTLLGIFSVAFSLAVQDVLKNFVAGIYILLEQPFKIGDEILIRDQRGTVESIEIRTTNMRTENGLQVVVPNMIIFSEILVNRSAYHRRLVTIRIILPPGEELGTATTTIGTLIKEMANEAIAASPAPTVILESISEGKTTARLEFWTTLGTAVTVGPQVALAVKEALPTADVALV